MYKKAQATFTDFYTALLIFVVLLMLLFFLWNKFSVRLDATQEYNEMIGKAYHISDLLVKNQGKPLLWENDPGNAETIGLVYSDRNISLAKLNNFTNLDQKKTKDLLSINPYEFYFTVNTLNGSNITSYGKEFSGDVSVNIRRYVLLENEKRIMEFILWK